jgi:hypothetical protein
VQSENLLSGFVEISNIKYENDKEFMEDYMSMWNYLDGANSCFIDLEKTITKFKGIHES